MMKELEKVMIEDVEYSYDPEKEYIKDGYSYCKVCNERDREAQEKERQKQMEIERLKSSCFNSII